MSKYARDLRIVRRGHENWAVVARRNRKAEKQFDRWWTGLIVFESHMLFRRTWALEPTGRGLIHKGRKP